MQEQLASQSNTLSVLTSQSEQKQRKLKEQGAEIEELQNSKVEMERELQKRMEQAQSNSNEQIVSFFSLKGLVSYGQVSLQSQLQSTTKALEEAKLLNEERQNEIDRLLHTSQLFKEQQSQLKELECRDEAHRNDITALNEQLNSARKSHEKELEEKENTIAALKTQLDQSSTTEALADTLQKQLEEKKCLVRTLEQNLDAAVSRANAACKERDNFRTQVDALQQNSDTADASLQQLRSESEELRGNLHRLNQTVQEKDKRIAHVENQLSRAREQIEELQIENDARAKVVCVVCFIFFNSVVGSRNTSSCYQGSITRDGSCTAGGNAKTTQKA